jgi:bifunctional polynucleotide phosphatase/kinase
MDYTIIKTKSGKKFPQNKDDWELLFGEITKSKLVQLDKQGFSIVIFTN